MEGAELPVSLDHRFGAILVHRLERGRVWRRIETSALRLLGPVHFLISLGLRRVCVLILILLGSGSRALHPAQHHGLGPNMQVPLSRSGLLALARLLEVLLLLQVPLDPPEQLSVGPVPHDAGASVVRSQWILRIVAGGIRKSPGRIIISESRTLVFRP